MPDENVIGIVEPRDEYALVPFRLRISLHEALKELPWREAGPGRWERGPVKYTVGVRAVEFTAKLGCCMVCDVSWPLPYMLRDEVWFRYYGARDRVCLPCFESETAHLLVAEDFTGAPVNRELIHLLRTRK